MGNYALAGPAVLICLIVIMGVNVKWGEIKNKWLARIVSELSAVCALVVIVFVYAAMPD